LGGGSFFGHAPDAVKHFADFQTTAAIVTSRCGRENETAPQVLETFIQILVGVAGIFASFTRGTIFYRFSAVPQSTLGPDSIFCGWSRVISWRIVESLA
jgi:hypothetical protein